MELIEVRCPTCGANIKVDPSQEYTTCEFCNTIFKTEELIEK